MRSIRLVALLCLSLSIAFQGSETAWAESRATTRVTNVRPAQKPGLLSRVFGAPFRAVGRWREERRAIKEVRRLVKSSPQARQSYEAAKAGLKAQQRERTATSGFVKWMQRLSLAGAVGGSAMMIHGAYQKGQALMQMKHAPTVGGFDPSSLIIPTLAVGVPLAGVAVKSIRDAITTRGVRERQALSAGLEAAIQSGELQASEQDLNRWGKVLGFTVEKMTDAEPDFQDEAAGDFDSAQDEVAKAAAMRRMRQGNMAGGPAARRPGNAPAAKPIGHVASAKRAAGMMDRVKAWQRVSSDLPGRPAVHPQHNPFEIGE